MSARSIRVRLTVWYLAVITPATVALAAGSWWLAARNVNDALDRTLAERIDGTRQFLTSMAREGLRPGHMKEEFGEYAELSRGEALLDVTDGRGEVLSRPTVNGWTNLLAATAPGPDGTFAPTDSTIGIDPVRVASAAVRAGPMDYRVTVALPTRASHEALRHFGWILAGLVPAVLVVAGLGGYGIAGRALAPVDRMTRIVQETTLRNLDRRLDVPPAQDELRRLAVTFNDMLGRMQAGVADLTRLTAEASHELRTPVSLVRTTAEVALSRPRSADEYREALSDVLMHAERMSALVGDLLMLARADAGVEAGDIVRVDLAALARDVAHQFQPATTKKSLAFDVAATSPVTVLGDAASLRRLLVIVVENAVAYTPPSGRIALEVGASSDDAGPVATIDVIDTGIGIDPADRARVFDRFYRGAAAREQAADGSGLGLSIARTIVERSRGTIEIAGGPSGHGCHVRIRLPARAGDEEASHASNDRRHDDLGPVGVGVGRPESAGR